MGVFLRTLAAVVAADTIDRYVRSRPMKHWQPTGGIRQTPGALPSDRRSGSWNPSAPERPT